MHSQDPLSLGAILSVDFGRIRTAPEELVLYKKGRGGKEAWVGGTRDFDSCWASMSMWTFGHPAPLLLPDGDVMVAYYAGDSTAMGIHWVRIRP